MANQLIGEIRMVGWKFLPLLGWLPCDGRILPISEFDELFQLIGKTYGGDGVNTFALPDMRGRVPVHYVAGASVTNTLGDQGGQMEVTLTADQLPLHYHPLSCNAANGNSAKPAAGLSLAANTTTLAFSKSATTGTKMSDSAVSKTARSLPHGNMQPYTCISFIISCIGTMPS